MAVDVLNLGNCCCHLCIFCNDLCFYLRKMCVCVFPQRTRIFSHFSVCFFVPIEITSRRLKLEFFDVAQQQASKAMEIFRKARLERNERALGRCPAWLKNLSQCLFDVS